MKVGDRTRIRCQSGRWQRIGRLADRLDWRSHSPTPGSSRRGPAYCSNWIRTPEPPARPATVTLDGPTKQRDWAQTAFPPMCADSPESGGGG